MPSFATFVRRTPAPFLAEHLVRTGVASSDKINCSGPRKDILAHVTRLIDDADEPSRHKCLNEADRISAMADEAGQTALFEFCENPDQLGSLKNGYARAAWMHAHETKAFQRAEEARFTDEHRRGRQWEGYVGQPGLAVSTAADTVERFKTGIREALGSQNVHVDIFDRQRTSFSGNKYSIVQITVYREGRTDEFLEFSDSGKLGRKSRKLVYEASLTYEADTGVIEVVAGDRESRGELVSLFAEELLGIGPEAQRLPFRQFNLNVLLKPYDFPTDAEDGIDSVRVTLLRLMPLDSAGERATLECSRVTGQTIWDMASDRFGNNDPLAAGWLITKAKLVIRFHPEPGSRRGKTLPLTVTMPQGCDLKERTERERLIGEKYLQRWRLVKNV
jgi:hypothetical protein